MICDSLDSEVRICDSLGSEVRIYDSLGSEGVFLDRSSAMEKHSLSGSKNSVTVTGHERQVP